MFKKTIKHVPGTPIKIYDHETCEHIATGYFADDAQEDAIKTKQAIEAIKTLRDFCKERDICYAPDCPIQDWCTKHTNVTSLPEDWEVPEL